MDWGTSNCSTERPAARFCAGLFRLTKVDSGRGWYQCDCDDRGLCSDSALGISRSHHDVLAR